MCVCPVGAGTVPSGLSDAPASVSDPSFRKFGASLLSTKIPGELSERRKAFVVQQWFAGQGDRASEINRGEVGAEF